ncbi:MAG TPA: ABC transporter permease [Bryobacteraceae bacterium]|nr:ABC transporter permease [Bryobacteraceae bacterium]
MRSGPHLQFDSETRTATVHLDHLNGARTIGWQIFDPDTGTFIREGDWLPVSGSAAEVRVELPKEKGRYHVYVSPVDEQQGWTYQAGKPFLLIEAAVEGGKATLVRHGLTTLRALRLRNFLLGIGKAFTYPVHSIWKNRSLIRSMIRRDIMARYRGSFADIFWTVLSPVLLMATYFFVFGVVLESRFGEDRSRTGFALYFLAGMLPWLPFAEAAARAPNSMLEHRTFIKKVVFPVEILTVTQTVAALITQAFALAVFLIALFIARGDFPGHVVFLPLLLVPQVLFTLGVTWFLSATGVFFRDLGQIMGFLLTLWFFITPICYPEASLPQNIAPLLIQNPIYALVSGYRDLLLGDQLPKWESVARLWAIGLVSAILGHAWFYKLRKSFADVI